MSNKIDKNTVPEGFTLGLVLVDAIPVILFGVNCILIGMLCNNPLFIIGAVLCLVSGAIKVLWKLIVVLKRKNIWPLFVQMRIVMPIGFVIILISVILDIALKNIDYTLLKIMIFGFPQIIFFILGLIGMIMMGFFGAKLDSTDLKSNWIEQITNGISQLCYLVGILFLL